MQAVGLWLPALTRSCQLHNAPTRSWRPAPHPDPCEPQQCPTLSPPPSPSTAFQFVPAERSCSRPPPLDPLLLYLDIFFPVADPKSRPLAGRARSGVQCRGGRRAAACVQTPTSPPPSKLSPPCHKAHLTATGLPAAPPSAHQAPPSAPQSCATGRSARTNPRVPPKTHPVPFISQRPPARRQPVSHPPTSQLSLHSPACGLSTPHVARVGQAQTPRFP